MSTASKVTLVLTTLGSIGIIYSVHKNQVSQVKYTFYLFLLISVHGTVHCKLHTQTGSVSIEYCLLSG